MAFSFSKWFRKKSPQELPLPELPPSNVPAPAPAPAPAESAPALEVKIPGKKISIPPLSKKQKTGNLIAPPPFPQSPPKPNLTLKPEPEEQKVASSLPDSISITLPSDEVLKQLAKGQVTIPRELFLKALEISAHD